MNYYNEWDSFAAEWLKQLIKDGLIPDGEVDSRSIADVEPSDLKGFTQCHFFAGIGGWSRALQLAGWSSDRPVWTGSPPCQSFSTAGKRKGKDDERHLWPVFFNLIRECQPPTVFGEQVAAAIRFGWLDDLQTDFEREGYASAAAVLPASGIGAYHKRDRLFFTAKLVADSNAPQFQGRKLSCGIDSEHDSIRRDEAYGSVGNAEHDGLYDSEVGRSIGSGKDKGRLLKPQRSNTDIWAEPRIIYCRDGKYRPIPTEPALFPLANGVSNRVGILRGAGNAIVPQAAAEIIKAVM
jgi:DNA (cytosine-5)-methyltransferase 1